MEKKIPNILPKQSYWMDQRLLTVRHNEFAWRATPPDTLEEWEEQGQPEWDMKQGLQEEISKKEEREKGRDCISTGEVSGERA